jgi:hypothetical protein
MKWDDVTSAQTWFNEALDNTLPMYVVMITARPEVDNAVPLRRRVSTRLRGQ